MNLWQRFIAPRYRIKRVWNYDEERFDFFPQIRLGGIFWTTFECGGISDGVRVRFTSWEDAERWIADRLKKDKAARQAGGAKYFDRPS